MAPFTHKNIEIAIDSKGQFVARVGHKIERKPSLDAMKKRIDDYHKQSFEAFDVLIHPQTHRERAIKNTNVARVKAVRVEKTKSRRSWLSGVHFVVESDGACMEVRDAYRDCPQALDANRALVEFDKEAERIEEERSKKREELESNWEAFRLDPNTYLTEKKK